MKKGKISLPYRTNLGFWIILILVSLMPLSLVKFGIPLYLLPQIEFSAIFFATIYLRSSSWQIFLYGLLLDVAYGRPIGASPLILLLIFFIIGKLKNKIENLQSKSVILHFIYTIIAVKIVEHIILSIYYSSSIVPYYNEIIINILLNIAFYILLHYILVNRLNTKNYEN